MAAASSTNAEGSADDRKGRICQFSKTKMCKFFVLGKCTKDEQCPFAHENLELRKLPDLRRTKLCKMLIQTGHCTSKSCTYAHSKEELRSTGAYHKTKLCRFMQTGHCTLGGKCNFAHSSVELREPETINMLDAPPGLGWESMIGGLLSDDDDEESSDGTQGLGQSTQKAGDLGSAYVSVPGVPRDSKWAFSTSSISEESTDCDDGFATIQEDAGIRSLWEYQMGMGCYSPESANLAFGTGYGSQEWAGPWAEGAPMPDQCASSLFSNAFEPWDWRVFGNAVVNPQTDFLKPKGAKSEKKITAKMR